MGARTAIALLVLTGATACTARAAGPDPCTTDPCAAELDANATTGAATELLRVRQGFDSDADAMLRIAAHHPRGPSGGVDEGEIESVVAQWVRVTDPGCACDFGAALGRLVEVVPRRVDAHTWIVALHDAAGHRDLVVTTDGGGAPEVRATVTTGDPEPTSCRVEEARLVPRRVLGVVVGVLRLDVRCEDGAGTIVDGAVAVIPG